MMKAITYEEIADWIIENRKSKAFSGYSKDDIIGQIDFCVKHNSMLVIRSPETEEIVGVCCAELHHEEKELFIQDILTTKPHIVKQMMIYVLDNYPNYRITGVNRSGRNRCFTQSHKLFNRL